VRVAIWNLGWNRKSDQLQTMWSILREEIGADVALLQETAPPESFPRVWEPIKGRRWGSAVVGFTVELKEVVESKGRAGSAPQPLRNTWPGSVAIAQTVTATGPVTFVSCYGVIENGYADTTVNRQLSDLAPLFDDPVLSPRLIFGGDLNITTQWTGRESRYRLWQAATFGRIKAFGLNDCLDLHRPPGPLEGCACLDGDDCRHIQTQRHKFSHRPWQNDYLFASQLASKTGTLTRAYVHDSDVIRDLGDHLPLVADFNF